ncbi:hypothetical protein MCUN1_000503 [Malassezia cuniculi]|uniref:Kinase n=1 Tax=Malassezia cuniculi TaxID=948313 RepID=A0AAF0J547_9BASI|nr:hypothetical protein MCUN1_000503 [Malassezia cuniculi]
MTDVPIQVSGHEGSLSVHADGSWVLKQCTSVEANFYQSVWKQDTPGADELKPLMPICYGIADQDGQWLPGWDSPMQLERSSAFSILLENLTSGFVRPCVSDWKIGTQLYDERDPLLTDEKRTRMQRKAAETTSGSYGLRVTGWQTWNATTKAYYRAGKEPGRAATSLDDLDELWRRVMDGDDDVGGTPNSRILGRYIVEQLQHIRHVLSTLHVRIRGASILVIYEGDSDAAKKRLESGSPVSLRLIDYAHARWCHDEGPDAGADLGLETLIGVVQRTCGAS